MLPLSMPAIASLTLLTFVTTWNDYLGPLIYLRSPDLWTLQLGLQTFISNQYNANYAPDVRRASMLSVLPIAVIFLPRPAVLHRGHRDQRAEGMITMRTDLLRRRSHATASSLVYLGLVTNLLLVVACLPLVVLAVVTTPLRSWPLLAAAAPLAAPGVAAAFTVFREHSGGGGTGPVRTFLAATRRRWRQGAGDRRR